MPRYIIKIKDKYFEWSTIVDAPVTNGMSLTEFRSYYQSEYGEDAMKNLDGYQMVVTIFAEVPKIGDRVVCKKKEKKLH